MNELAMQYLSQQLNLLEEPPDDLAAQLIENAADYMSRCADAGIHPADGLIALELPHETAARLGEAMAWAHRQRAADRAPLN